MKLTKVKILAYPFTHNIEGKELQQEVFAQLWAMGFNTVIADEIHRSKDPKIARWIMTGREWSGLRGVSLQVNSDWLCSSAEKCSEATGVGCT